MKVKDLVQQVEYTMGRQPEQYMLQLINDALMDMSGKVQHYTTEKIQNLNSKQRWYKLDDSVVDITRVEVLDNNNRYVKVPLLADSHKLLKDDTDETSDSLT
jgi:hypothetical protein|tara:strand:+ start:528 stop:833 length:306 start_codon:yes stop_codon:yes gene_type:complete